VNGRHWLIGLALLASACGSQSASFAPKGPVIDQAGVLSPKVEQALEQRLRDYWVSKETAIVVATVETLDGVSIDLKARRLFAEWGIGARETNRRLLVLIAPSERKARIEVGCGLETVVTNAEAKRIMDDIMVPRFAEGQFDTGAVDGVAALVTRLDTANVPAGPVSPFCVEIMKDAT